MKIEDSSTIVFAASTIEDGNMSFLHGETPEVAKNRRDFLARHGLSIEDCIMMRAEHTDKIVEVTVSERGLGMHSMEDILHTEALMTRQKGLVLCLLTADCFPVAFYDPEHQAIALAHLGWKPTDLKLVQKVVRSMSEAYSSNPAKILVSFGPGIHESSYLLEEVGQADAPEWQPYLRKLPDGKTAVDLQSYNIDQLLESGVISEHITRSPADTFLDGYFSHYREIRSGEPTGRFINILARI